MRLNLTVNGEKRTDDVDPRMLAVHYLRDVADLTGTHVGCATPPAGTCELA